MTRRRLLLGVGLLVLTVGFITVSRRLDWWEPHPERRTDPFLFQDGFESAANAEELFPRDASRWHGWQREGGGTVELTREKAHSGTHSLKLFTPEGSGTLPKADIVRGGLHFVKGDSVWFSGWFWLEEGGDSALVFLWDLEASNKYGSPGRRLYLQSGEALTSDLGKWWGGRTFRQPRGSEVPFPKDRWVRLKVHLHLSEDGDGQMEVWQDETKVLDAVGQTLPTAKTVYDRLQVGLTASGNKQHTQTLYLDDVILSNRPLE